MLLQKVGKAQDGALIRQACGAVQANKATVQGAFLPHFFHRRIAQVPTQLQAVDAQHGLHRKRRAPTKRLVCATGVRLDERNQGLPRHDLVPLFKKHFLARLLVEGVQPKHDLVRVPIFSPLHDACPVQGAWGFADFT